jgi:hypothetical protein
LAPLEMIILLAFQGVARLSLVHKGGVQW